MQRGESLITMATYLPHSGDLMADSPSPSRRGRLRDIIHSPGFRRLAVPAAVTLLLSIHAALLAHGATRHSPTLNEPGHLVAGLAMWEYGRFDVYRVNPPLTRLVAALPVVIAGYEMDWSRTTKGRGARPEFASGPTSIKANGPRSIWLFTLARWACIPFATIGGVFIFFWARELYGTVAGLVEFNPLVQRPKCLSSCGTDYSPTPPPRRWELPPVTISGTGSKLRPIVRAALAGLFLGVAQLSKMSWIILFGLWPVLWLFWPASGGRQPSETSYSKNPLRQLPQLLLALFLGL